MYSGDEFYDDEITSGASYYSMSTMDDDMREAIIDALIIAAGYTRNALIQLSDDELWELADDFGIEV